MWKNYAQFAEQRASLVLKIIEKFSNPIVGKRVLDIGCGEGATAFEFLRHSAHVTAIDIRNQFLYHHSPINFKLMPAEQLAFPENEFDIIILQDVLEHTIEPEKALSEATRALKSSGIIYLSTPNRLSPFNFISDPHWDMPLVSILPRRGVAWMVKKLYRRDKRDRKDWAALISLFTLKKMLSQNQLDMQFVNSEVVNALFKQPASVVCSPFHLKAISILKKLKLDTVISTVVNDNWGVFNYWINPTWYIISKKKLLHE
jgi:2-polyprenyl-3-methyl-5-hydroxy-6-metoxy-1,4-benzoquinol methylase